MKDYFAYQLFDLFNNTEKSHRRCILLTDIITTHRHDYRSLLVVEPETPITITSHYLGTFVKNSYIWIELNTWFLSKQDQIRPCPLLTITVSQLHFSRRIQLVLSFKSKLMTASQPKQAGLRYLPVWAFDAMQKLNVITLSALETFLFILPFNIILLLSYMF